MEEMWLWVLFFAIGLYDMPITYDTGSATTLGSNSNNVTTSSISTSTTNELLIAFIFGADNTTLSYITSTAPLSYSNNTVYSNPIIDVWHELVDSSTTSGSDTMMCVGHTVKSNTGSTGTITALVGNSSRHGMIVGAFKLPNVQILKPSQDMSSGAWTPSTGANLYSVLDESTYDDNDYISTTSASTAEIKLSAGSIPEAGSFSIRYRAKYNTSGNLTAELYQGTTLIATHSPPLTPFYQTFIWTLSLAETNSITDYTDLRIKFISS